MIFVTDLDKTFLSSDLSISEFSKKFWNSFPYPLTIATARSYKGVTSLLKGINLKYPLILLDGAMIVFNEKIIKMNDIDKATADELIFLAEKEFDERPLIVGFEKDKKEKFLKEIDNPFVTEEKIKWCIDGIENQISETKLPEKECERVKGLL